MMKVLLELNDISVGTPEGRILQKGVSFRVSASKLLLIRGPNGSGKSTLIKLLAGIGRPSQGDLRLNIARSQVQFLPQLENTETHMPATLSDVVGLSRGKHVTTSVACQFGLLNENQLAASWNTASGGERKRALLTCALLSEPSLLLLDEPMNHLDQTSRRSMIESLSRYLRGSSEANPRAAVMVCHQGLREAEKVLFDHDELSLSCWEEQWKQC